MTHKDAVAIVLSIWALIVLLWMAASAGTDAMDAIADAIRKGRKE